MKPSSSKIITRVLSIAVLMLVLTAYFFIPPFSPKRPTDIIDDDVPLSGARGAYFLVAHPGVSFDDISSLSQDSFDYVGYGSVIYTNDIIDNPVEVQKNIVKTPDISSFESSTRKIEWRYLVKIDSRLIVAGVLTESSAPYFDAEYYLFNPHDNDVAFTNVTPDLAEFIGNGLFYYTEDLYNQVDAVWNSVASEPDYSAPDGVYIEWSSAYAYNDKLIVIGKYVAGTKPEFPNAIIDSSDSVIVSDDTSDSSEELIPEECEHVWEYLSNNDGTHLKICKNCEESVTENCDLDSHGICKLCGFKEAPTQFASISELKKATLKEGDIVSTLGYYSKGDGGGTTYVVAKSTTLTPDDGICIALSGGLYAVIEDQSLISVKNYGVKGDGTSEDFNRLKAALSKSSGKIYIPAGSYDFKGKIITLNNRIAFIGEGKDKTIIKNLGLDIKNGIELHNICFDGGADFVLYGAGGIKYNLTGVVTMHPENDSSDVVYKSCIFKNVGFASTVTSKSGRLNSDYVSDCEFYNIGRIAIHHSINIGQSTYTGNIFDGIGSSELLSGPVAGIWIGDLTNNTYAESDNVVISNNVLKNLYTGDDPFAGNHNINANLVAVSAKKATISDNSISDVHGFGEDRESLYTKVADLTITGNTLTNAGYGEGYITCKGHTGKTYTRIIDNDIIGTHGSGIYTYGAALIQNNRISISNCRFAIVCFHKETQMNDNVTVSDNEINCNPDYYYYDGVLVDTFKPSSLIRLEGINTDVFFLNNTVNSTGASGIMTYGLKVSGIKGNVTINDNTMNINVNKCGTIAVTATADYTSRNKDAVITIKNNDIVSSYLGIQVIFKNQADIATQRQYFIENNIVKGVDQAKYGVFVDGGVDNQDSLNYVTDAQNTSNVSKAYARVESLSSNNTKQILLQNP